MPKHIRVQIGPRRPHLHPVKVQVLPTPDDALYKAKRTISHLKHEVSRLQSKIRRMEEDLTYEISGWQSALDSGERQESMEAVKRRISRLKGAIAFTGVTNLDATDAMKER